MLYIEDEAKNKLRLLAGKVADRDTDVGCFGYWYLHPQKPLIMYLVLRHGSGVQIVGVV